MGRPGDTVTRREIKYDPLPSQKLFHDCPARFKGFSGPVGSGKSQALCQEALRLSYQNPGRTGLLGAPTFPMLRDATQATLFEILEENAIPFDHNKAEATLVLKDTGSRILFRSTEEYERLRGTNLAWFGMDELTYTPEEAWVRMEGRLHEHFGGSTQFALVQADAAQRKILDIRTVTAPPHAPGLFPRWLHEQGANVVIAGGIGRRALALFAQQGITVRAGQTGATVEELANAYLNGQLPDEPEGCSHHHDGTHEHHHSGHGGSGDPE